MIVKAETMAEMVRAYAIKVNTHEAIGVVAGIGEWAYHYILNWYNEKGVIDEDWSDLAMCDEDKDGKEIPGSSIIRARRELYKKAMRSYKRATA